MLSKDGIEYEAASQVGWGYDSVEIGRGSEAADRGEGKGV